MVHPFGIVPSTNQAQSVLRPARYMSLLALVLALGIFGEPALPYTLPLLENLQDAPEA